MELVEKLVRYLAHNSEQESCLLFGKDAQWLSNTKHILNFLRDNAEVSAKQIDEWLVDENILIKKEKEDG